MAKELAKKCPFKFAVVKDLSEEEENVKNDDRDSAKFIQENSGGTLGKNLTNASHGKAGTINKLYPANKTTGEPAVDTKRAGIKVKVKETADIAAKQFPFTVAAHHLIPGNASLAAKACNLYKYMVKGKTVKSKSGKSWKIKANIGYNVNGAHNGVWLPGNYGIRKGTSPIKKKKWGDLVNSHTDWCLNYVVAVTKKNGAQFHDSHAEYSKAVLKLLNAISEALLGHQIGCTDCKKKDEVPPPYRIKTRLYNLSQYFKSQVKSGPVAWKLPWIASDKWKSEIIKNKKKFLKAYMDAEP